jgi:hypothetical protein
MPDLRLYAEYSRKEVHDIFAKFSPFHPQVGVWGMNGVVRISKDSDDFVFFVRLDRGSKYAVGQELAEDGTLKWLAPLQQDLKSPLIQALIKHAHPISKIYLFLKTKTSRGFLYMGNLQYQSHDPDTMHPIEFKWKLLNWPPPEEIISFLFQAK